MTSDPPHFDTGLRPDELDPERPRAIETPWGTMALYVLDDGVACLEAFCPHLAGPLFQGSVARDAVTCPWHFWRYDLRTGERVDARRLGAGEDARALVRCEVRIGFSGTLVLTRPVGGGPPLDCGGSGGEGHGGDRPQDPAR
jgi:nitrite reductase/ring-hydroxylating ferredoxin subunit